MSTLHEIELGVMGWRVEECGECDGLGHTPKTEANLLQRVVIPAGIQCWLCKGSGKSWITPQGSEWGPWAPR